MTYAALRAGEFPFGANCDPPAHLAGGFADGSLDARRHVVRAEDLFRAFHELDDIDPDREAFGTVFQYPPAEYAAHVQRVGSPKGYSGPAACCRLAWDIDREHDLDGATADARKLVTFLLARYGAYGERGLGVYFSGAKGYHVTLVALPGFHPFLHVPATVKLLCLTVARKAGVTVDPAVYDRQRLFRLPNSRHPRSRLHKRFLELDELFQLSAGRVRELAAHPAGFPVPCVSEDCEQLAHDWCEAEEHVLDRTKADTYKGGARKPVVPDFVRRFIAWQDIADPGRAVTVFRCAAALAEAGTPPAVVCGLLAEPALKTGLDPAEVEKQLADGITHGSRKGGV